MQNAVNQCFVKSGKKPKNTNSASKRMGKKKERRANQRLIAVGLVLVGVLVTVLGGGLVKNLVEDYQNNIGVTIKKVRFKFTGSLLSFQIFGKQVNIPRYATWFIETEIRNDNLVGATVQGFDGWLRYGSGSNAVNVAPLTATQFAIPGKSVENPVFQINQDLLNLPLVGKELVSKIKAGEYKKIYVAGKLRTSVGSVDIEQEVSLLEA